MLDFFPVELVYEFGNYLDKKSLIRFSAINKNNYEIYKNNKDIDLYLKLYLVRRVVNHQKYFFICKKNIYINYIIIFCNCSKENFECLCDKENCKCRKYPIYHQSCARKYNNKCVLCKWTYRGINGNILI